MISIYKLSKPVSHKYTQQQCMVFQLYYRIRVCSLDGACRLRCGRSRRRRTMGRRTEFPRFLDLKICEKMKRKIFILTYQH